MSEKTTVLKVRGMHCEGCASNIGVALHRVKGVRNADVSFDKERATVTFDSALVDQQGLEKAIRDAGFEVQ